MESAESAILMGANLQAKRNRPSFSHGKICDVFCSGNLIEIGFLSGRCCNDRRGACIMCDYGAANGTRPIQEYLVEMDRILEEAAPSVHVLLLCTNGSFLDRTQISQELFQAVLERAAQSQIGWIEIETHYKDVTPEKLRQIQRLLPNKRVAIEMGLETANPVYQSHIIMKGIDLAAYERTVALIQSFGFLAEVNIMVGLPFLSPKEQFDDAVRTMEWAFRHGCSLVVFPMNIKPYTLLMEMFRSGHYQPISSWMLPLLLDTLSGPQLEQVTVAWYGNREEIYPGTQERAVFPRSCPSCAAEIDRVYRQFPKSAGGDERKALLAQLFSRAGRRGCSCLADARNEISAQPQDTFESRYAKYISYLKNRSQGGAAHERTAVLDRNPEQ